MVKLKSKDAMQKSIVNSILRYPLLLVIYLFIFIDLIGYTLVRVVVSLLEWLRYRLPYRRALKRLSACTRYAPDYVEAARNLDQLMGLGEVLEHRNQHLKPPDHLSYGGGDESSLVNSTVTTRSPSTTSHDARKGQSQVMKLSDNMTIDMPAISRSPSSAYAHFDEHIIHQHIQALRSHMGYWASWTRHSPSSITPMIATAAGEGGNPRRSARLSSKKNLGDRLSSPPSSSHQPPNILELVECLESCCKSNLGGIENESHFSQTFSGSSGLVEEYVGCVEDALELVASASSLSVEEKFRFFKRISTAYGRSALCLSGGARLAFYHLGTVRALFESDLLPTVITGTSGGSLVAAMICVRTDNELLEVLTPSAADHMINPKPDTFLSQMWSLWKHGTIYKLETFMELIQWYTKGPTTFFEAYQATGRILNIMVVSIEPRSPSKLLNYLTAPDVLISTAVLASCAIPGVLPPVELLQKTKTGELRPYLGSGTKWRDGSLKEDIPERELHRLFNVNYTIVSQVNPHVTVFFYNAKGSAGNPSPHLHRFGRGWRGGFISAWIIQHYLLDLQKWLSLIRDMDLLPYISGLFDIPTSREDIADCLCFGANQTFAKLPMISSRMRIERVLGRYRRLFRDSNGKGVINSSTISSRLISGNIEGGCGTDISPRRSKSAGSMLLA